MAAVRARDEERGRAHPARRRTTDVGDLRRLVCRPRRWAREAGRQGGAEACSSSTATRRRAPRPPRGAGRPYRGAGRTFFFFYGLGRVDPPGRSAEPWSFHRRFQDYRLGTAWGVDVSRRFTTASCAELGFGAAQGAELSHSGQPPKVGRDQRRHGQHRPHGRGGPARTLVVDAGYRLAPHLKGEKAAAIQPPEARLSRGLGGCIPRRPAAEGPSSCGSISSTSSPDTSWAFPAGERVADGAFGRSNPAPQRSRIDVPGFADRTLSPSGPRAATRATGFSPPPGLRPANGDGVFLRRRQHAATASRPTPRASAPRCTSASPGGRGAAGPRRWRARHDARALRWGPLRVLQHRPPLGLRLGSGALQSLVERHKQVPRDGTRPAGAFADRPGVRESGCFRHLPQHRAPSVSRSGRGRAAREIEPMDQAAAPEAA